MIYSSLKAYALGIEPLSELFTLFQRESEWRKPDPAATLSSKDLGRGNALPSYNKGIRPLIIRREAKPYT
jgi:hypothetical protein